MHRCRDSHVRQVITRRFRFVMTSSHNVPPKCKDRLSIFIKLSPFLPSSRAGDVDDCDPLGELFRRRSL
jgi:hypothetical protein